MEFNERTKVLIGDEKINNLANKKVSIFGIGGVGSYVTEAIARAGVGTIVLIDKDTIDITNVNRQIHALHSTIGRSKVLTMKERILDINPKCNVIAHEIFYLPGTDISFIDDSDYVVDAIDNMTAKLELAVYAKEKGLKIISSMGTANRLNPLSYKVCDIKKTLNCPVAKIMRKGLKDRGIYNYKVVFSDELPVKHKTGNLSASERPVLGSMPYMPGTCGLIIASEVIKYIMEEK